MVVISVSLSGDELKDFDALVKHFGYDSRSVAVRAALHHFVNQHKAELGRDADVVLSVTYPGHRPRPEMHQILHENMDLVRTSLHNHEGERCVDILLVHGSGERVHALMDALTRIKDVQVSSTPY